MSRLIRVLIVLVLLAGVLQWLVPKWAAGEIASQVARYDHSQRPVVSLTAIPFWELATGRFEDLYVDASNVNAGPLKVQSARLNWANGQISVPDLIKGRFAIVRPGHVDVRIRIDGAALAAVLAQHSPVQNAEVTITPQNVRIRGRILLGGVYLPLDATGTLVVSSDRRHLIFHPTVIDGINLPMMTDIEILDLTKLQLPVPLVITSVVLEQDHVVVTAKTP